MKLNAWILLFIIIQMAIKPCLSSTCSDAVVKGKTITATTHSCCQSTDGTCSAPIPAEESSDSDCCNTGTCLCQVTPLLQKNELYSEIPTPVITTVPSYDFTYSFDHLALIWHPPI